MPELSNTRALANLHVVADGNIIYSSAYASLRAALTAWTTDGGTLVINKDYDITDDLGYIALSVGKSFFLRTDGPRTINYTGSAHLYYFLRFYSEGPTPLYIDANLTVNVNSKANVPCFIQFENCSGSNRRDLLVRGLILKNARRVDSLGIDACGLAFNGGFDRVLVEHVQVINVSRAAGVNTPGSNGCGGISYSGGGGDAVALHMAMRDCLVFGVTTDDLPTSANYLDCDGIRIFQQTGTVVNGTPPVVERCIVQECAGRAFKLALYRGGGIIRDCEVYRTIPGGNDIALQNGDGLIENCTIRYGGTAHSEPTRETTPIGLGNSTGVRSASYPYGPVIVRNIKIIDNGTGAKHALVSVFDNTGDASRRSVIIEGVADSGTVKELVKLGALGSYSSHLDMNIRNVNCELTIALCITEDTTGNVSAFLSNVRNRGTTRPVKAAFSGAAIAVTWQNWKHDGTVLGVDMPLPGDYANDAAAAAGGVPIGGEYRNGSVKMVRVV